MSRENILNIKVGLAENLIGDTTEVSTATWCQHTLITDTEWLLILKAEIAKGKIKRKVYNVTL